jgi:hypothetical protein
MSTPTPLWEYDHPYYCADSNYLNNDCHQAYVSWQGFHDAEGDADPDMNLVFRWDWKPTEYLERETPDVLRAYADRFGDRDHAWLFHVYWMGQRKGLFRSTSVSVCKADEPAVREWLAARAAHLRRLWAPLLGGAA